MQQVIVEEIYSVPENNEDKSLMSRQDKLYIEIKNNIASKDEQSLENNPMKKETNYNLRYRDNLLERERKTARRQNLPEGVKTSWVQGDEAFHLHMKSQR